jgi:hypothetical protein
MSSKKNPGATMPESAYEEFYDKISYFYGFEPSVTNNAPLWNFLFLILAANIGWMVIRKKYKLLFLPTNAVMILLICLYTWMLFVLELVPVNVMTIGISSTRKQRVGMELIKRMENHLGPDLVYKFALPFIVIGEAFEAGPNSYVFTNLCSKSRGPFFLRWLQLEFFGI